MGEIFHTALTTSYRVGRIGTPVGPISPAVHTYAPQEPSFLHKGSVGFLRVRLCLWALNGRSNLAPPHQSNVNTPSRCEGWKPNSHKARTARSVVMPTVPETHRITFAT
jgi:hypothetical protein